MLQTNQQQALDFLSPKLDLMVEQLHSLCQINSGSYNLDGLQETHTALANLFEPIADDIQSIPLAPITLYNLQGQQETVELGKALYIRKRPACKRRILLLGHMDTVFPADHPFQTLTQIDENRLNGPGVSDMKGGLLVILHALSAFEETMQGVEPMGWDVLITPDEEIGSFGSSALFESFASRYQAVMVYEPAMDEQGTIAKNRKGSGLFTIVSTGKASHVGRAFNEGRNAICHLAEVITDLHQLNQENPNVILNVGLVGGGDALNVVPDTAVAKFNIRINDDADAKWCHQALQKICLNHQKEGFTLSLHGDFHRPAKRVTHATERLFNRICKISQMLGFKTQWQDTGGCCDGNNWSHLGLPVIDTLGVRGGNIHRADEYIMLDSLLERASLSALLLLDLAAGSLEDIQLP